MLSMNIIFNLKHSTYCENPTFLSIYETSKKYRETKKSVLTAHKPFKKCISTFGVKCFFRTFRLNPWSQPSENILRTGVRPFLSLEFMRVCLSGVHSICTIWLFKKCDFRFLVYIFQVQNSRNGLEFSVKLNLHKMFFPKCYFSWTTHESRALRATLPCRCNLV